MSERINLGGDDSNEWIDYNSNVQKAVTEKAMNENLRLGEAFVAYIAQEMDVDLSEVLGGDDDDDE